MFPNKTVLATALWFCLICTSVRADEAAAGIVDLGERALTGISSDSLQVVSWSPTESGTVKVWSARSGKMHYSVTVPSDKQLLWVGYLGQSENPSAISASGELLSFQIGTAPSAIPLEEGTMERGTFAVSPDGKTIAYGGTGAKVWDSGSGTLLTSTTEGHQIYISFMNSGNKAVFLSEDSAAIWSRDRGSIAQLAAKFPGAVFEGTRSTTGRYVAAPSRDRIEIIDVESERTEYVEASEGAQARFGLKDTELAVIHGPDRKHQVDIWNLGNGLDDLTFRRTFLSRHENVAAYSEGQVLCCNLGSSLDVVLHEVATGASQSLISDCYFFDRSYNNNEPSISAMAIFNQNSRAAIATGKGVIGLWDLKAKRVDVADGDGGNRNPEGKPSAAAVCLGAVSVPAIVSVLRPVGDNGSLIAECSNGQVYFLAGDLCFPKVNVLSIAFANGVPGQFDGCMVDFSPNGGLISVTAYRAAYAISTKSGEVARSIKGSFFLGKFDDSGEKLFLLGSGSHGLGDLKSGQFLPLGEFGTPTRQLTGKRLVTGFYIGGKSDTKTIAEAATGKVINTVKFESLSNPSVRLSDDGKTISAVGHRNDSSAGIELVDVASGQTIISMNIDGDFGSYCKAISDSRVVAVASERGVSFYDVRRRRLKSLIPASKYWIEAHPDSGVKYAVVDVRSDRDAPKNDKEELSGRVQLHSRELQVVHTDVCESKKLCLIAEGGRLSLWQYETGELLWVTYTPSERPVQALLTSDGMKAAVMTNKLLQIVDLTSIVANATPAVAGE